MKRFIILFIILILLAGCSPIYYADRMKWITEIRGTHDPYLPPIFETVTIEQTEDKNTFKVYTYEDDAANRKFAALMRVNGDKVHFNLDESGASEWYLLYDFGLREGEGCYVYDPTWIIDSAPRKEYIKCIGTNKYAEHKDLTFLTIGMYKDESCSWSYGTGCWIKGLSSLNGLLYNIGWGFEGGSYALLEVSINDTILYQKTRKNYFVDGLTWRMEVVGTHEPNPTPDLVTVTLEQTEEENIFEMYSYYDNDTANREFEAYIRTIGDYVMFTYDRSKGWYNLYNFGLRAGEGCYVSRLTPNPDKSQEYVKCTDISVHPEYKDLSVMTIESYEDKSCTLKLGDGVWIKGLSSLDGIIYNTFGLDGVKGKLIEVSANGTILYSDYPAGMVEALDDSTPDIRVSDKTICVNGGYNEAAVYTIDGRLVAIAHNNANIKVETDGIYIVRVDGTCHKVVVK